VTSYGGKLTYTVQFEVPRHTVVEGIVKVDVRLEVRLSLSVCLFMCVYVCVVLFVSKPHYMSVFALTSFSVVFKIFTLCDVKSWAYEGIEMCNYYYYYYCYCYYYHICYYYWFNV